MKQLRWYCALPLACALSLVVGSASAASIRDEAGMFSAGALKAATAQLDEFERATKVPVIIETVSDLGLPSGASKTEKYDAIEKLAISRDRKSGNRGIFLLISKGDHVISNTLIPQHLASSLPADVRRQVRDAFGQGVSNSMRSEGRKTADKADQDAGLKNLVAAIERTSDRVARGQAGARNNNLRPANVPHGAVRGGGSSMSTFLMIGLGILAVLFLVRMIGGLFGGGQSAGMGGMGMPRPGMGPGPGQGFGGPGYGPGYGPAGYGGRGGGFFSGMLGGLGGALAGNWLYDQMSGRHGSHHTDASSYPTGDTGGYYDQGNEPIVGADDGGSGGASWGDSGGDWGGGDGGADWGGGGGDWGGGDGGGDW